MIQQSRPSAPRSPFLAVLGPTNTGKTHLAMERMLGHASGMIGFPLRLLARENYERAVTAMGERQVALITGEERIEPPEARYFLCTVESMPLGREVAFLAVDEIQMCADPDRGHIFTDRLLHARGGEETMVMGAETIRPLIRRLVPEAEFIARPRFSALVYSGPAKLSRLPPRSAIVAFSVAEVYALAELIRRQRGGTAIVLGALSPRTRNAQVAMYQAGEVDYLVATDAIGMGLNMQVDHVAFAATRKFDGRTPRSLSAAELAQIAGRAGRFTKNGTFGTTADIGALDPEIAERIQTHKFETLRSIFWRSATLNFTSLAHLRASLARQPAEPGLVRAREADDELTLAHLAENAEIVALARTPETIRLLWEVCQIPDFGKVATEAHAKLVAQIYRFLAGSTGKSARLPTDWVARQVDRSNRTDGDIDALMQRIAAVRTWTYVAHRPDWLDAAADWRERTRAIEDRLSDALHDRLVQRFVDRRTALLVGRMRDRRDLVSAVNAAGEVLIEGHPVGTLAGFRFLPAAAIGEGTAPGDAGRIVRAVTERALREDMPGRVARLEADGAEGFSLAADAHLLWRGAAVARLTAGPDILRPRTEPLPSDLLGSALLDRIRRRLDEWLTSHLEKRLPVLFLARRAIVSGPGRGLLYQLSELLGSAAYSRVAPQIAALTARDRALLRALSLRFGAEAVWFPQTLKPAAIALRALLKSVHAGLPASPWPEAGRVQLACDPRLPAAFYEACGYHLAGGRAIRIDMLEKLAQRARKLAAPGSFAPPPELASLIGCSREGLIAVLADLGYESAGAEEGLLLRKPNRPPRQRRPSASGRGKPAAQANSPFAALGALKPRLEVK